MFLRCAGHSDGTVPIHFHAVVTFAHARAGARGIDPFRRWSVRPFAAGLKSNINGPNTSAVRVSRAVVNKIRFEIVCDIRLNEQRTGRVVGKFEVHIRRINSRVRASRSVVAHGVAVILR